MNSPFSTSLLPDSNGRIALKAGEVLPLGLICEPFGETPFMELINRFSYRAISLKEQGAQYISINNMSSLAELRAAIFGAWHAKLPVLVNADADEHGEAFGKTDILSVLLAAQGLGINAFALHMQSNEPTALEKQLARLAAFAKIPLLIGNAASGYKRHSAITAPEAHQPNELVLCSETEVFYLDESYELSELIPCGLSMADNIMSEEDAGCDVLLVHLTTNEDAYCFSQSAHMAKLPVCFFAENEEALESGLIYYNGRTIIDARSGVPRESLETLAAGYGAILR